ncbi:2-hydroxy-3-oxopropionate reductase [Embleya scabrispora]|uniref:2-hydroxy-3-oxopropionate reductase n=1 Tax=Embleya scabrispora TaxID=159449 RepID=UPI0003741564|nr:2-hydroxy-3-oxopropionate reductase [Embleya scabrispora]MYS82897.1 2-hydroxy-3-oxopropionate reductase [Streptomyces sp. SID5474]
MTGVRKRIAFVGLGIMGGPMAAHLVRAGHEVTGFDLERDAIDRLIALGGKGAATIAEAVRDADVVITMVPADPHVEKVMFGGGGVLRTVKPGTLVIDMSSIKPGTSIAVAEAGAERELRVLDAPVSGGEAGAIEAVLSVMVGGEAADFAAALPLFEVLGKTVIHVGPHGAGQTVKAANQLIVAGNIQLVAEALLFLERAGVDTEAGLRVLAGGLAGSTVLDRKARVMRDRDFKPGFRIDLHHKDMGIVTESAREFGLVLPLAGLTARLVASLRAQGGGGLDHCGLLLGLERLNGRPVASGSKQGDN